MGPTRALLLCAGALWALLASGAQAQVHVDPGFDPRISADPGESLVLPYGLANGTPWTVVVGGFGVSIQAYDSAGEIDFPPAAIGLWELEGWLGGDLRALEPGEVVGLHLVVDVGADAPNFLYRAGFWYAWWPAPPGFPDEWEGEPGSQEAARGRLYLRGLPVPDSAPVGIVIPEGGSLASLLSGLLGPAALVARRRFGRA